MDIASIQVAHRGFQRGLPIDRIYSCITRELEKGTIKRTTYRLRLGDQAISVHFTRTLVESWKLQYDEGQRIEIPTDLLDKIDDVL